MDKKPRYNFPKGPEQDLACAVFFEAAIMGINGIESVGGEPAIAKYRAELEKEWKMLVTDLSHEEEINKMNVALKAVEALFYEAKRRRAQ